MHDLQIRAKLAIALLVPLLALLGFASTVVVSSAREAGEARDRAAVIREQIDVAQASLGPNGTIDSLQRERNAEVSGLLGIASDPSSRPAGAEEASPAAFRTNTDQAVDDFRAALVGKPVPVRVAFLPAQDALDKLPAIRAGTDSFTGSRDFSAAPAASQLFARYTEVIGELFDASSRAALSVDNAKLRNGAHLTGLASRDRDLVAQLTGAMTFGSLVGGLDESERRNLAPLQAASRAIEAEMRVIASVSDAYAGAVDIAVTNADLVTFHSVVDTAVAGGTIDLDALVRATAWRALASFDPFIAAAAGQLDADARALRTAAEQEEDAAVSRRDLAVAMAAAVVLAATTAMVLASRSIREPLLRLTREANDMAHQRLPTAVESILETPANTEIRVPDLVQVPTEGGREIAEVATALNAVQDRAAALAVEQAQLRRHIAEAFVNCGRRSQDLLSRQQATIATMEQSETDPDQRLRLLTLDHLSTRMQRSASSLLLLAGVEPPLRRWSAPVPLPDVLRAALGEIEADERVALHHVDPALIDGTSAPELSHLLAELIENALRFTPTGRRVEIVAEHTGAGAADHPGTYRVSIIDNGIGMTTREIDAANARLAGHESLVVLPSSRLGHHVVAILADRLGVEVTLEPSPRGGITANVGVGRLLVPTDRVPRPPH